MKNLGHDSRSVGQDLKTGPPKYNGGPLGVQLCRRICYFIAGHFWNYKEVYTYKYYEHSYNGSNTLQRRTFCSVVTNHVYVLLNSATDFYVLTFKSGSAKHRSFTAFVSQIKLLFFRTLR